MKALTSNEWFDKLSQLSGLEVAQLIEALKPLPDGDSFQLLQNFQPVSGLRAEQDAKLSPLQAAFIHLSESSPAEKKHEIEHVR